MKQLLNNTAYYTANTEIAQHLFQPDNWRRNLSFIENRTLPESLWFQAVMAYIQGGIGYTIEDYEPHYKRWSIFVEAPLSYSFRDTRTYFIDKDTYDVIRAWKDNNL